MANQLSDNIFQKLPQPFTITDSQIRSYYQMLYTKLKESFISNDFNRINNLLDFASYKCIIPCFKYPPNTTDTQNDTILIDLIKLLYDIITIYPFKYYNAQLSAATFLGELIMKNKDIEGLSLDRLRLYKIVKSIENLGDFMMKNQKDTFRQIFIMLSVLIKKYFTYEEGTTEKQLKKFLSKSLMLYFQCFNCSEKVNFKPFFDYFITMANDDGNLENSLTPLYEIFTNHTEEDFSIFLPILKRLIIQKVLNQKSKTSKVFNLLIPDIIAELFVSPPTRKGILEIFDEIFQSIKNLGHPSSPQSSSLFSFIDTLTFSIHNTLNRITKEKSKYIEICPSQEEIHKFFYLTSEFNINNIHTISNPVTILIETKLDPSLIDHYFEVSFQCINMIDAINVAKGSWNILTALIMSIEKNEILINKFESLFLFATNNLHNQEIQIPISKFIVASFIKIPFNKEKTLKGLDYVNFTELSISYFTNLFSILKSLPAAKDEFAKIDSYFYSSIIFSVNTLFAYCDNSIFDELLPIFSLLATDEEIVHCPDIIEIIITAYCLYCNQEQSQKIEKSFKRQLDLQNHSFLTIFYLLKNYVQASMKKLKTNDSIKQIIDYILKYTENKNEKIRDSAWRIICHVLNIHNIIKDIKICLKKELINDNIFEFAELDDFDIVFNNNFSDIDFDELSLYVFNPFLEKLLTSNDQNEIIKILKEVAPQIFLIMSCNIYNSDGSKDDKNIDERFIDSIHLIPDLIKKSIPLKDKFIKCALRILKDFPENENIISTVIKFTYTTNNQIIPVTNVVKDFIMTFYNSKKIYNLPILHHLLENSMDERNDFLIFPLNNDYKQLIEAIVDLSVSNLENIQNESIEFISESIIYYSPFINSVIIERIFNKMDSIKYKSFLLFLSKMPDIRLLLNNDKLLCKTIIFLIKNFDSCKQMNPRILIQFFHQICIKSFPNEIYDSDKEEYIELLNELEKNYLFKDSINKTYNFILILTVYLCLKHVKDVNEKVLDFITKNITHYNAENSTYAFNCLIVILSRRQKFTKEKVFVKEITKINNFPSVLNQVSVKFPENGIYFPFIKQDENESSSSFDEKIDSVDSQPSGSLDVNIQVLEASKEIKKVFDTFEKVEIDWKNDELFESNYFLKHSIDSCPFELETYTIKKYEFVNDLFLIKNIKNIFASAMNSLNDKSAQNEIPYFSIWHNYALTVGPYCIDKLHKRTKQYLTQYYQSTSEITATVLFDMIFGFSDSIRFWNIKDRIRFFKLVVFPAVSVISSNPKTSHLSEKMYQILSTSFTPYFYGPILKVFYEISPNGPNVPFYGRTILSIITNSVSNKPFFYFNSIEKLKEKFIDPFISHFDEYKTNEIENIINLLFAFLKSCSLKESKSIFYSKEIEDKKKMIINTFDDIFNKNLLNDDCKRNMVYSFSYCIELFIKSKMNIKIMFFDLILNHLHKIFYLLNNFRLNDDNRLINNLCSFIENDIFIVHNEIEFNFFSVLIKEMMNSSLILQLNLSISLNKNIEKNIFYISFNDYQKFEEILLNYNRFVIEKNLGNEMRLNIAKILGIFEIRNCTFVENPDKMNLDDNLTKAGSIILNSYLFDHSDEKVERAFKFIENYSSQKDSKSKDFYESVTKIFINRHSNHVINEVEELVNLYRNVSMPSYIT